jgi:NADPH:quinone reductase-like Zn-dependent oxidoreductase
MAAGQHVLVQGGVGIHVVQIAAGLGARVSATAAAADLEFVKGLGAEQAIDYAHASLQHLLRRVRTSWAQRVGSRRLRQRECGLGLLIGQ